MLALSTTPTDHPLHLQIHRDPEGRIRLHKNTDRPDRLTEQPWTTLAETTWPEKIDSEHNLYLPTNLDPHLTKTQQTLNLTPLTAQTLLTLIITPIEDRPWKPALDRAIQQLEKAQKANKNYDYERALKRYQELRDKTDHSHLYQINLFALSQHPTDAQTLLETVLNNLLQPTTPNRPSIKAYPLDHPRFQQHLDAIQHQKPIPRPELTQEEQRILNLPIAQAIKAKSGSILSRLSDNSLGTRPQLSSQFKTAFKLDTEPTNPAQLPGHTSTPSSSPNASTPTNKTSSLANTGGSSLSRRSDASQEASTLGDLRPLSNLFNLTFRNRLIELFEHIAATAQTQADANRTSDTLQTNVTLDHFQQHHLDLIDPDRYIVGISPTGNPITSSFAEIPHRFIAGATGAGKSNFIKFLLYQLFLADPTRTIWLADFKGGSDFLVPSKVCPGLKIVSDYDEFGALLEDFWQQHEQRIASTNQSVEAQLDLLLQSDIDIDNIDDALNQHTTNFSRNILIIDEMAQLSNLKTDRDKRDLAKAIDTNINKIARLGRSTGTHLICCTQSQEIDLVPTDLLNNIGDRLIFRVEKDAVSNRFLGCDKASRLPQTPKGRAIYRGSRYQGSENDLDTVITPLFPQDLKEEVKLWKSVFQT